MDSVWIENIEKPSFKKLKESKKTDVHIIGGGIAGILCLYMLRMAGVDCLLTEASEICGGLTKNTTAKITLQHGLIYHKLIEKYGIRRAEQYLLAGRWAEAEYERLCENISCDYEKAPSLVYSLNDRKILEEEHMALGRLGLESELCETDYLPFKTAGALMIKSGAQFHPLKFLYSISKDLPIYENTKILEIMPGRAIFDCGVIESNKTVIATHFPILNKHGAYFLKMYQHRSYVLALRGADTPRGMLVDEAMGGLSFRGYKDLLLLGGGSHRTGKRGGSYCELENFAEKYYPDAEIVARWATQDCMTLDGVPYVGKYSKNTENLFVTTGFNKWGMTNALVSAQILRDMILGMQNPYADVFSPARSILHPQLAINAAESIINLLTPTAPRCPHLGCALKYNKAEHSWDCPCHGSRFTEAGQLIDNPATDDKKSM